MSDHPLMAFIKHAYHKTSWRKRIIIIYIITGIGLFLNGIFSKNIEKSLTTNFIIGICLTLLLIIIIFIDTVIYHYRNFKKNEYLKIKLPDKIEEIESGIKPDIWLIIKNLENRINDIDKNLSPFCISLYAIFVGISVAVALLLIAPLLQKILFSK